MTLMLNISNRADMVGKSVTKSGQEGSVGCLRLILRNVTQHEYTELVGPTFEEGLYVFLILVDFLIPEPTALRAVPCHSPGRGY